MQALQTIKLILGLLPLIIDTVKAIEAALPQAGQGAAKLALVRETLQAGFQVATDSVATFEQVWPAIERVIGSVVGLFNRAGVFQRGN
jgi:hypothetical protein